MTLRVALLAHSTNPRGGVVHALALADALTDAGIEAVVHAPDPSGQGFFRPTRCATVSVPASPVGRDVADMVETRAADYVRWFEDPAHRRFDVFHAGDGISANALATLKDRGLIAGFVRTVHHVDAFADPRLAALQTRALVTPDRHLVVSRLWQRILAAEHGIAADRVGNGVDMHRYRSSPDPHDRLVRARHGLAGPGPLLLAVGGVEARKNTRRILDAFVLVRAAHPTARLVIAGGASLLDHDAYQAAFAAALAASGLPEGAVLRLGPVPDADMPSLYRIADALVFPSVKEGFGLVVLEAMASACPVVLSRIAPFTEYCGEADVAWCDPEDPASIAGAVGLALDGYRAAGLAARGLRIAADHDWAAVARAHLPAYAALTEAVHA
ncbi:MSMEG_0565 family glycosyltransferase [Mongoliimonas terrestris]|uniref:MSMEG_0565 family glycosyltransferase n=1 Tax=Mongoliimonas terrestris TaxID=1709001 RepID=UPI0009498861|nr:MSMEG_0565 family glycosyltransferase [Mongoliimonas terrestris]